jgi:hypothetical protein
MSKSETTRNLTTLITAELHRKRPLRRWADKTLDHLEDLEVDGIKILKRILNMLRGTDWIHMVIAALSKRGARFRSLCSAPKTYCAEQKED